MIFEGTEYPLPKTSAANFLYANKKGDTGFVEKIKNGFAMTSDGFDVDFKTEQEIITFFKKHNWHFTGVE